MPLAGAGARRPCGMVRDQTLVEAYRCTICEVQTAEGWRAVIPPDRGELAIVTAWNPGSRRLPEGTNQARDRVLAEELRARGLDAVRVRGRDQASTWVEEGFAIPHDRTSTLALLRRYGQLAAFVFRGDRRELLWADGDNQPIT
jgi:hypothetical protein